MRLSFLPNVRGWLLGLRLFNGIRLRRRHRSEFCLGLGRVLQLWSEFERQLVDLPGELERRIVAILDHRHPGAGVLADVECFVLRKRDRRAVFDGFPVYFLAVHREYACAALAAARTIRLEVEDNGVLARAQLGPGPDRALEVEQVVDENRFAAADARNTLAQEKPVAAEASAFGDDNAFRAALGISTSA